MEATLAFKDTWACSFSTVKVILSTSNLGTSRNTSGHGQVSLRAVVISVLGHSSAVTTSLQLIATNRSKMAANDDEIFIF